MTSSEWYSDPLNAAELAKILNNPVLRTAIEVASDCQRPGRNLTAMGDPTLAAATFHYQSGYFDAFKALHQLTQVPVPRSTAAYKQLSPETPISH